MCVAPSTDPPLSRRPFVVVGGSRAILKASKPVDSTFCLHVVAFRLVFQIEATGVALLGKVAS